MFVQFWTKLFNIEVYTYILNILYICILEPFYIIELLLNLENHRLQIINITRESRSNYKFDNILRVYVNLETTPQLITSYSTCKNKLKM